MTEPIMELIGVSKCYRTPVETHPLRQLSLVVEPHDFIAVQGGSGTGKTTLLNVMASLVSPDEGQVRFRGVECTSLKEHDKDRLRRSDIGMIFQKPYAFSALTVRENLAFVARHAHAVVQDSDIDEMLELFGLDGHGAHLTSQLSIGQQRRLAIARCLLVDPALILADEPTNDLDDRWCAITMDLFTQRAARPGRAVVMVTHDERYAPRASARYHLTGKGVLVCEQ